MLLDGDDVANYTVNRAATFEAKQLEYHNNMILQLKPYKTARPI